MTLALTVAPECLAPRAIMVVLVGKVSDVRELTPYGWKQK